MHATDDQDSPTTCFKPDITILSLVSGTFENDVSRIWGDAHLHEYLAASNRRRHVWHCWLSSSIEHADPYKLLTFSKAREIITEAFGNCPSGLIGALGRLGRVARDPDFYHQLFRCFEKGGSIADYLQRQRMACQIDVEVLDRIAGENPPDDLLGVFLRSKLPIASIPELIWLASRTRSYGVEIQFDGSIAATDQPIDVMLHLLDRLPFPKPALTLPETFRLIETVADLERVGIDFKNCLRDKSDRCEAAFAMMTGRRVILEWVSGEPALVSLTTLGSLGWVLHQVEGVRGKAISADTIDRISAELKRGGAIWISESGWGLLRYLANG